MAIQQLPAAGGGASLSEITATFNRSAILTNTQTWTHPDSPSANNPLRVFVIVVAGGGGGASGATATGANAAIFGGWGGGSGYVLPAATVVTSSVSVTVGAGGTGGAGVSRSGASGITVGTSGNAGGDSSFGNILAKGGRPGYFGYHTDTVARDEGQRGYFGAYADKFSMGGSGGGVCAFGVVNSEDTTGGSFGNSSHRGLAGVPRPRNLQIINSQNGTDYAWGIQEGLGINNGNSLSYYNSTNNQLYASPVNVPNDLSMFQSGGGGGGGNVFNTPVTGGPGGYGLLGNGGAGTDRSILNTAGAATNTAASGNGYGGGGGGSGSARSNLSNNGSSSTGSGGAGAPGAVIVYY
jgi:hypothetical protein